MPRRRIKLWQLLLATAGVAVTLAFLPNHRVGAMIFLVIEFSLLLAILLLLVIDIVKKLTKR